MFLKFHLEGVEDHERNEKSGKGKSVGRGSYVPQTHKKGIRRGHSFDLGRIQVLQALQYASPNVQGSLQESAWRLRPQGLCRRLRGSAEGEEGGKGNASSKTASLGRSSSMSFSEIFFS